MMVATLNLTLGTTGKSIGIIGVTIFWRVILGIGIGGDCSNSSVLVSEFASVRWRGAMMAAVFAAQGLGTFSAALISYICATGFRISLDTTKCDAECRLALDKSWRIVYGFGMLPALIALYFRLTVSETIRYTLDVSRKEFDAASDAVGFVDGVKGDEARKLLCRQKQFCGGFDAPPKSSFRDFRCSFGLWKNGKVLLGTAGSWFLLDAAFVKFFLNYC